MSVYGALMIFSFASSIIHVAICCLHPFIRYWQPLLGKTTATCSQMDTENERQRSVNHCQLPLLGNLCSDWLQTSIHQISAAVTGPSNSDMMPVTFWKWASTECQQFYSLHIWWSRHHANLCVDYVIIDHPDTQQYNIWKVKHRFQTNRYCKLQSMPKHNIGCWKRDFNKILLTNSTNMSLIWMNGWTGCATSRQCTQFRRVGSLRSNCTRVDGSYS